MAGVKKWCGIACGGAEICPNWCETGPATVGPLPGVPVPPRAGVRKVYIIGSLRNARIRDIGQAIREWGYEVFDDWHAVGPEADDHWRAYEKARGRSYQEALHGAAAQNTFAFDKRNLDAADAVVLVAPAGKSGHMELGYTLGKGKPGFVLYEEEPERWDVMYLFATAVYISMSELNFGLESLK